MALVQLACWRSEAANDRCFAMQYPLLANRDCWRVQQELSSTRLADSDVLLADRARMEDKNAV